MSSKFRDDLKELAADIEKRSRVARDAHFLVASRWDQINLYLGISVVLIGVVGGGAAGTGIAGPQNAAAAAIFATLAGLLGALNSFLKPGDHVAGHKRAGDSWSILRDSAANLYKLKMERNNVDDGKLQEMYDALLGAKQKITEDSPIIPTWAYNKASETVKRRDKQKMDLERPETQRS